MQLNPLLFKGAMVRSVQAEIKSQTRRPLAGEFMHDPHGAQDAKWYFRGPKASCWDSYETFEELVERHCPYGKIGDQLWVKESYRTVAQADDLPPRDLTEAHRIWYEADAPHQCGFGKLRPSIFMPMRLSRIRLTLTNVRVERLKDITEADARAEGCGHGRTGQTARKSFQLLWQAIHGSKAWDANPLVWVLEFKSAHAAVAARQVNDARSVLALEAVAC